MGTTRISRVTPIPATEYNFECDWVAQSQAGNYSTLYIWIKAINRGSTGAYSNNTGSQTCQVDGVAAPAHVGTMPSGVPGGGVRWYDGPYGYNVAHDAAGNLGALTLHQIIAVWHSYTDAGSLPAPARIPKPPNKPGPLTLVTNFPTQVQLSWLASTNNNGSAIDGYLLRHWYNSDGTGGYVDDSFANDLIRWSSLLEPGHAYRFVVYAHNGSSGGYSVASDPLIVTTLAPLRVKVGGVYKYGIIYLKTAGQYKVGVSYVKVAGAYKQGT